MRTLKGLFFSFMLVAVLAACGDASKASSNAGDVANAGDDAVTYMVQGSNLAWTGKKVTGQHNGTIQLGSGEIKTEAGKIAAGTFAIDMSTIKVLDMPEGSEYHTKLTRHLHSADFFNTDSFPTASFDITKVVALENNADANHIISGNLTIKGISQEISFPAQVSMTDNELNANGTFTIDRTLWDIKFRSGKFFEDLGDNLIYDDIEIALNLKANRSGMAMK